MIDIERSTELKIRLLKHLRNKEWFGKAISSGYLKTSIKELHKKRGIRYQDLSSRQFERLVNIMVKDKLVTIFRNGRLLYYRITETGGKYLDRELKGIREEMSENISYLEELLKSVDK